MAAKKPPQGKKSALENPVFTDSFISIGTAGGTKPASRRKPGRNRILIETNQNQKYLFHLYILTQDACPFGQRQITSCQLVKGGFHCTGPGHHNNVPAGLELFLIQAVYFPDAAAGTVTDVGLAQFFTNGNTHPIAVQTILPGIEHQKSIGLTGRVIQPPENVIQL